MVWLPQRVTLADTTNQSLEPGPGLRMPRDPELQPSPTEDQGWHPRHSLASLCWKEGALPNYLLRFSHLLCPTCFIRVLIWSIPRGGVHTVIPPQPVLSLFLLSCLLPTQGSPGPRPQGSPRRAPHWAHLSPGGAPSPTQALERQHMLGSEAWVPSDFLACLCTALLRSPSHRGWSSARRAVGASSSECEPAAGSLSPLPPAPLQISL